MCVRWPLFLSTFSFYDDLIMDMRFEFNEINILIPAVLEKMFLFSMDYSKNKGKWSFLREKSSCIDFLKKEGSEYFKLVIYSSACS